MSSNPTLSNLLDYESDPIWTWVFRPMLSCQIVWYFIVFLKVLISPTFNHSTEPETQHLFVNHLGNYSILRQAPETYLIFTHMFMALSWVIGWYVQSIILQGMCKALRMSDYRIYKLKKSYHVLVGQYILIVAILGCCAGPIIAYRHHMHLPMKIFLLIILPGVFLPIVVQIWRTARQKDLHHIARHKFWATSLFLGAAMSSLWAAPLIRICGRYTRLGPLYGELVGTFIASVMHISFIVLPAYRKYKNHVDGDTKNYTGIW